MEQADPGLQLVIQWNTNDAIPVAFPQEGSHGLQTLWTQRQQLLLKDGILYRKWEDAIPVAFPQEGSHGLQTLWTQRQQLLLKDGILYRKWEDVPGRGRHQHLQLILSQELVPTVLDALRNHPTAGHLGVTKTLQKVRSSFYWPGQRTDVDDWCRACNGCASRKMLPKSRHAPLQLHQPGVPLQ